MKKIVSRMLAATAAFGLVAAPIVAQANTRSADSGAMFSAPGLGRAAAGEGQDEEGNGGSFLLTGLALTAIIAGILIATDVIGDDDGDCASPGAC